MGEGSLLRKILIIGAAVALLCGGGAGAYFMFFQKPAEAALPADEHASDKKEEPKKDDHATKDEHGDSHGDKGPTYVKMDPLVVPVMDREGISQTVSMLITLEVADEEGAKKIEDLKPRVKDAMIQNMYGMLYHASAMENGAVKISYIKERLNQAAVKVMGEGVVKDVLLQMVQQNPI